jgi:hypothetical protein
MATTAREDARPTEMANCVTTPIPDNNQHIPIAPIVSGNQQNTSISM